LKHWLKAEEVKEKIVKKGNVVQKAAILVHPTQRGGGGPHVCVEFAKEDCVEIYMEMCRISMPELFYLSAPIHIFYIFFMCEEISFKYICRLMILVFGYV
jgi:hypothetical protein